MHPELLLSLAAERRRDLHADIAAHHAPRTRTARRAHALTRPVLVPRFRVSWTHTTLAAASGSRRANSVVIVISATRTS